MRKNKTGKLAALHTPLGVRSVYDSVCFCNRCGMCAPVCPSYAAQPKEATSPRGRNQAFRLFLEGKLKNNARNRRELVKLITSCTLCGRCSRACPGQIPTAQHMLEFRRRLRACLLPRTLFACLRLRQTAPWLFEWGVRCGLWLHRVKVLPFIGVLPGFGWVKHVCELLPSRRQKPFMPQDKTRPTRIYLPSLEAQFILPDLARSVYDTAAKKHRVCVWKNTASGLFEYVYGDLARARKIVRGLIIRHSQTGNGKLPLLSDSIDVYNFFKQVPQLFEGFPTWVQKAQHFADCVRFVCDVLPKKPAQAGAFAKPVFMMSSALLADNSPAQIQAGQILHTLFKKNFVQCGYTHAQAVPAGYGFVKDTCAPAYELEAVRTLAKHQVQTVFVLSGLAALELDLALRRFYPAARAEHIARLNG